MAPRLDGLRELPGVSAAALVGRDGLPLAALGEGADLLAAELTALRGSLDRLGRRLGVDEVSRLALTTPTLEVVALAQGDYVLGAALVRGIDTSAARQRLAALMDEVQRSLPAAEAGADQAGSVSANAGAAL
ncbi:roadblock/LC7 domain-containing protein [Deinococcus sp. SL84]|uniref:roadblock/LC7 domain-containing protein n=1 Tax=Deinococcus sp. SL84 TaxID=2994663 RepID=UPI0022741C50|nr:roadblock/LC7 domain-containing protein [Deinococcus sp. SL84]MCY1702097.1 roadblock/LC7 domain-containing protein [Deinococcus sp. SL84]